MRKGAEWYQSLGTEDTAGVKIFSLSGCVNKPGNYELPFGTSFRELIFEHGGGIANGNNIKAIMPAGASSAILVATEEILDTPMDYSSVREIGAELGSASVIVIDDSFTMDWVINKTIHFFDHESCGKCTPCRDGNYWMKKLSDRIYRGQGTMDDVQLLDSVAQLIQDKCLCALGEFAIQSVITSIDRFPEDFKGNVQQ
jgi:NADH-quinone oxidoreductase subunit F